MGRKPVRVKLNPDLIIWARTSAGYTEEEISKSVGTSADSISAWEEGSERPTIRQLEKFANKVKRPLAALFLSLPPKEPPPPKDFRMLPETRLGAFTPETLLAFRRSRNLQNTIIELIESLNSDIRYSVPHFTLRDDPEEIAFSVRERMGFTTEQVLSWDSEHKVLDLWRETLLNSGILVLQFSIPTDDVRGFSIEGEKISIITVSTRDPVVARIFSVFHEYCHLCLREPGVSNCPEEYHARSGAHRAVIETFCNQFSAAFLLPLKDKSVYSLLKEFSGKLTGDPMSIYTLSRKLKVSKYVLLIRMHTARLISDTAYNELSSIYHSHDKKRIKEKSKGGPSQIVLKISERGKPFSYLVFDALENGYISQRDASEFLELKPKALADARDFLLMTGKNS
jgi:Zn-dependent peptidase ImmA (M78 family)/transcriptional regulator with XRE-family HTH domain